MQQLKSKTAETECERLYKESEIIEDQRVEAIKQRRAILEWKENQRDELNALSRRNSYRRQVQQEYFLTENLIHCLEKAHDRKMEEFERAYAE